MKQALESTFSDKNFSAIKAVLDDILPFMLLLIALLVVFQFAFPVTQQFQHYITLANWGVMAYFAVRLTVDYKLSEPGEKFWRNHWLDVLMVIPMFSIFREARVVAIADEAVVGTQMGEEVAATSALRNSRAAAKITRIMRMLKRSF